MGASRLAHSGWLRFDTALHALRGGEPFPSDAAIGDCFPPFNPARIEAFWRPRGRERLARLAQPAGGFTLDLDWT